MKQEFFYHSFPRHYEHDPNFSLGLNILSSILKNGLLLTAEAFPQSGTAPQVNFIQQRICFTCTTPKFLGEHANDFGKFSIEFRGDILRGYGVQPAFYLAGSLPGVGSFNDSGGELAYFLSEIYVLLKKLWDLKDIKQEKVLEDATNLVLSKAFSGHYEFQRLAFAAKALCNLYYHTDKEGLQPLHFFQQREWKIIPCFAFPHQDFPYRPLTVPEKEELLSLNPNFFSADVLGTRRVDACAYFSTVDKNRIANDINRIIVPNEEIAEAARAIVADEDLTIPVITLNSLLGIKR